jgi:hypothetical protein
MPNPPTFQISAKAALEDCFPVFRRPITPTKFNFSEEPFNTTFIDSELF